MSELSPNGRPPWRDPAPGRHRCTTKEESFTLTTACIHQEKLRQKQFINLIPSENFTSQAVLDALGSPMQSQSPWIRAPLPCRVSRSRVKTLQINTRKGIPGRDIMEGTSSLTGPKGYARSVHWKLSVSTTRSGESTFKVSAVQGLARRVSTLTIVSVLPLQPSRALRQISTYTRPSWRRTRG